MRMLFLFLILILLSSCAMTPDTAKKGNIAHSAQEPTKEQEPEVRGETMRLTSDDFIEGGLIPKKFTCQGENINPQLAWIDIPPGVKSFALIVDDPDAPGGLFKHWLVKDIPSDSREIKQDSVPGTQIANDYGMERYKGPCPPALHRYFFKLYALDVEGLGAKTAEELYDQVEEHVIAKAELMGKYKKI